MLSHLSLKGVYGFSSLPNFHAIWRIMPSKTAVSSSFNFKRRSNRLNFSSDASARGLLRIRSGSAPGASTASAVRLLSSERLLSPSFRPFWKALYSILESVRTGRPRPPGRDSSNHVLRASGSASPNGSDSVRHLKAHNARNRKVARLAPTELALNRLRSRLQSEQSVLQVAISGDCGSDHEFAVGDGLGDAIKFLCICEQSRGSDGRSCFAKRCFVGVHDAQALHPEIAHRPRRRSDI